MHLKAEENWLQASRIFSDRRLPSTDGWLSGYSALLVEHRLAVPLPETSSFISEKYDQPNIPGWQIFSPRYKPKDTFIGHLEFALKYDGIDLALLNALFKKVGAKEIENWVKTEPTGKYSRLVWFYYEWLTGQRLPLDDVAAGNYVDALDPERYFTGPSVNSSRHRVRNNLPGTIDFCPLVRRTDTLKSFMDMHLEAEAGMLVGDVHPDLLTRAAAFLLLKDSRASFAIEGETPKRGRAERWGKAIAQAGISPLSIAELLRLQTIIIEDSRLPLGLRKEGGFIGIHERLTGTPLPDHISARWQDLPRLMEGLIKTYNDLKTSHMDAVVLASTIAFGFVFIHPFVDGNGRLHRYLIHHVLCELGFTPKALVFPVSSVILERLEEYRLVLESYSRPRLECVEWRPTEKGNLEVLNETIDLYRFYDGTRMAEFLYDCVRQTVEKVLPEEIRYLENYDRMKMAIADLVDMPDYQNSLMIQFLEQNKGKFSKRSRIKEFSFLSDDECTRIEKLYADIFSSP